MPRKAEAKSAQLLINEEYVPTKKLEQLEEEKSELQEIATRSAAASVRVSTIPQGIQHALNKLERIDMDRTTEGENSELLHQMVTRTATRKWSSRPASRSTSLGSAKPRSGRQIEAKRKGMLKSSPKSSRTLTKCHGT